MKENNSSEKIKPQPIRLLIVDDSENDVLLMVRELKNNGFNLYYERIETADEMKAALRENDWDIILCDYNMPELNALSAVALLKEAPNDIPVIIVSGAIGEETAIECMRLGAQDYIMKSQLSRLGLAVDRALEETAVRKEHKKAEENLRISEEKYRAILENMEEGYFEVDLEGNFTFFNDTVSRVTGYSREELMGMNNRKYIDKNDLKEVFAAYHRVYTTGEPEKEFCWRISSKDGSRKYIAGSISLNKDSSGKIKGFRGIVRDTTERRQAEDSLSKSEELYTKLVNSIPDIIIRMDLKANILYVNDNSLRLGGYKREEVVGRNLLDFIAPENREDAANNFVLMMEGKAKPREYNVLAKDGRKIPFEVHGDVLRNEDGTPFGIVNVGRNLSERKSAEMILRENEEHLRGISKNLPGIIFQFCAKDSGEYGISYISERLKEFLGTTASLDMAKDTLFPLLISQIHEEDRDRFLASMKTAVEQRAPWDFEGRISVFSTGKIIWFQGLATPTRYEDRIIFNGIVLNVNRRKKAEEKSRQSEEKFHKIFMTTPNCIAITRLKDGLMIDVNRGFEDIVGWKRSEVLGTKSSEPPMNFWLDQSERNLMAADLKAGMDIIDRQFQFRRSDGSVRDGIYSARLTNIEDEACLIFILQDITDHLRMDVELRRTLESLRKAVGATIQVMIQAIEMRDPYTAGHQSRVSDLARAIATDMGLSQDRIDGIRMAGNIHDIGKLSIPAEILTKPTKLTKIEYSLIKEHSQSGYEMLKDVESPWPLAQTVHQHHERMDGTGYPGNLKREEIILEARILAVADVVEAMASHRPYRASLGTEAALDEIEKNKGLLYDEEVVNTCLKLFREKGYKLP